MAKGGGYEREMSKKLSLWWTYGKRDDIFWRTAGSGGRATTRMKIRKKTADSAGDLMALSKIGKPFTKRFLVEIKRGYTKKKGAVSILTLLDSKKLGKTNATLFTWVKKALLEKKQHKRKDIIIIFRRDRKEACVALEKHLYDRLDMDKNNRVYIFINEYKLVIILLEHFLQINPAQFGAKQSKRKIKRR